MEYTLATMHDLPAIKSLLARYHKDTISQEDIPGGFVTTRRSDQQFEDLIVNRKGVTLAKDENGTVKAFALAAGWDYWMQVPIMKRMTEVLPDMPFEGTALDETNTYQYGPVCVDVSVRGTGVFEGIFKASLDVYKRQAYDGVHTGLYHRPDARRKHLQRDPPGGHDVRNHPHTKKYHPGNGKDPYGRHRKHCGCRLQRRGPCGIWKRLSCLIP